MFDPSFNYDDLEHSLQKKSHGNADKVALNFKSEKILV